MYMFEKIEWKDVTDHDKLMDYIKQRYWHGKFV